MPEYDVILTRARWENATVRVEADDEDAAETIAIAQAEISDLTFEPVDTIDEISVLETVEVADDGGEDDADATGTPTHHTETA